MYQVSVEETFSAGHALRGYKGKCENVHGHNYKIRIVLEGAKLDSIGLLCDFADVKRAIRHVIGGVDHRFLNDQAPFDAINPSAENIARYFHDETERQLGGLADSIKIKSVTIWETDVTSATYLP